MNQSEVWDQVRDSISGVHMHTPVESIMARASTRRRHRRVVRAGAGAGVAAIALAVGLLAVGGSGARPAPTGPSGALLTAFSIGTDPSGASTLTLRKGAPYRLDPDALRQALGQHGISAVVNVGRMCDSVPEPVGLDQVISSRRLADGSVSVTFDPAAMPAGSQISIGYFTTATELALVERGAPLHCTSSPGRGSPASGSAAGAHAKPVTPGAVPTP